MPRAAKTPKPDANAIYVSWMAAAVGEFPVIQRGTRLRGDSEIVQTAPWLFVEDGVPENEWPSPHSRAGELIEAEDTTPEHDLAVTTLPLPMEHELVVLNRRLRVLVQTSGKVHEFSPGTRFQAWEPMISAMPSAFDPDEPRAGLRSKKKK